MLTPPPPSSYTCTNTHRRARVSTTPFLCEVVNVMIILIIAKLFAFLFFFIFGVRCRTNYGRRHQAQKTQNCSVRQVTLKSRGKPNEGMFIQSDYWCVLMKEITWLLNKGTFVHFLRFSRKLIRYPHPGLTDEDRSAEGKLWQSEG